MKFVIQVIGDQYPEADGLYVSYFDANDNAGRGRVEFTADPAMALRFDTHVAAFEFYRTQSQVRPFRPDGQPNRPLTAYTVVVERR